jgi:hypothetical protein
MVHISAVPFEQTTFADLSKYYGETADQFYSRCFRSYCTERDEQIARVVGFLMQQWPCEQPSIPYPGSVLRADRFREQVLGCFLHCFRNRAFHEHLGHVENLVKRHHAPPLCSPMDPYQLPHVASERRPAFQRPSILQLIQDAPAAGNSLISLVPVLELQCADGNSSLSTVELEGILRDLAENTGSFNPQLRQLYVDSIESSRKKLDSQDIAPSFSPPMLRTLTTYHMECRTAVEIILRSVHSAFEPHAGLIRGAGQAPRINVRALFSQLLSRSFALLPPPWQHKLLSLAQAFVRLQRSQRLLRFASMRMEGDLSRELANHAFEEDEAFWNPEWLLLQVRF